MVIGSPQSDVDSLGSKYSMLHQPIKDLSKNWNVDVASYLEDYLEDLEKIEITFDGGKTTMNFVEAALLIQGSACVYSKKVEYLYSLVCQVLDLITNKKKQGKTAEGDDGNNDDDSQDKDEEFLTQDNVQEHKNRNVKEEAALNKSIFAVPSTPLTLLPSDDSDKGDNPLLSKTGQVLGSRNDFRMNTSVIHPRGCLLLDMSHLALLDYCIKNSLIHRLVQPVENDEQNQASAETEEVLPHAEMDCDPGGGNAEASLAVSVGRGGCLQDLSAEIPPVDLEDILMGGGDDEDDAHDVSEKDKQRNMITEKRPVRKQAVDPWKLADAHDSGSLKDKIPEQGKTLTLPAQFSTTKKRKRNTNKNKKPGVKYVMDYVLHDPYNLKAKKLPLNSMLCPKCLELQTGFWIEEHRKKSLHKQIRKSLFRMMDLEDVDNEEVQNEDVGNVQDCGDDDEDNEIMFAAPDEKLFDAEELETVRQTLSTTTPLDLLDNPQDDADIVANSYEDRVRMYVAKYLAGSEQYERITELSKNVQEWEDKIIPRLEEEETHQPFDIHKYGSTVLGCFEKPAIKIPFRRVAVNRPGFEVSRLFLSTLQLANALNVKIYSVGRNIHEAVDKFEIEFLSSKRHYEDLQEYQAPSITK